MNVFSLFAKLSLDRKDFDSDLSKASSSFSSFAGGIKSAAGKIGGVLSDVAKGATVAVSAASTAVTALAKKSLNAYADYEQLVGGVEKIFGKSAEKVKKYADEAYKEAGLSSNQYMEQVTSFSASLLQGLKGDTEKAADIANMAIKDMADNANTYGTDIAQIQSNYQALAKQNYQLLDNLKLGYGGTKGEMARLLNDANKIDSTILGKGVTVDEKFEDVSFAQMIRAIHVIQEELKITGTTQDEAVRTISGSFATMKAAWQNFLTGTGTSEQFVEALGQAADNIFNRLDVILPKLTTGLSKLVKLISPKIPGLIKQALPTIISGASTLLQGLAENLPGLIETLLPSLVEGTTLVVTSLVDTLPDTLSALADAIPLALSTIMENSDGLLTAGEKIFGKLSSGLVSASEHFDSALEIILKIGEKLTSEDVLGNLLDTAKTIIKNLAEKMTSKETLDKFNEYAPTILSNIVHLIGEATEGLLEAAETIIVNLFNYMTSEEGKKKIGDGAEQVMISIGQELEKASDKLIEYIKKITDWLANELVEEFDGEKAGAGIMKKLLEGIRKSTLIGKIQDWYNGNEQENRKNEAYNNANTNLTQQEWEEKVWNQYEHGKIEDAVIQAVYNGAGTDGGHWGTPYDYTEKTFTSNGGAVSNADQIAYWAKWHHVQGVPVFGNGGIVTKPTLALIGEDGKEAVVPLEKDSEIGRKFGGGFNIEKIEVNVNAHGIDDINEVGNIIVQQIDSALRRYQVQQTRGIGGTAW